VVRRVIRVYDDRVEQAVMPLISYVKTATNKQLLISESRGDGGHDVKCGSCVGCSMSGRSWTRVRWQPDNGSVAVARRARELGGAIARDVSSVEAAMV
jgi:hypothetical protein